MYTVGRNQATTIFSTLTYIWAFIGNTLIHTEHSHTKNKVQIALVNTENLVHIDTITTTNANTELLKIVKQRIGELSCCQQPANCINVTEHASGNDMMQWCAQFRCICN
jgi:hypothetical protein